MNSKFIATVIIAFAVAALPLRAEKHDCVGEADIGSARGIVGTQTTRMSSVWRSAVLPGWGQYYRGDRIRGLSYGGATALALVGMYYYGQEGDKAYSEYKKAGTSKTATEQYDRTIEADKKYAICGCAALAIWAVCLADAFIFTNTATNSLSHNEQQSGFSLRIQNGDSVKTVLQYGWVL